MKKAAALRLFNEMCPRESFVTKSWRSDGTYRYTLDKIARWEAWNNFTDMLCKDGQITDHQYSTWVSPF